MKLALALLASVISIAPAAAATHQVPTLVLKARALPSGVSRAEAVAALGAATWVVIPVDKGEYRLTGRSELFRLYWAVPGCVPASISFDAAGRATGLAAPHLCGADALGMTTLPESQSCAKADRRRLCK